MTAPYWTSDDGTVELYCGDCRDVLPTLPAGSVDAVVTDPPYGIGAANKKYTDRLGVNRDYGESDWDARPCVEGVSMARELADWQIIFGGNYYDLPPTSCWLVWDKMNGDNGFADCELAWTNLKKAVRRIRWLWHGMIRRDKEERFHPTQKPVGVMAWCIGHLPADAEAIIDPFAGVGTTGVACVRLGRRFIGIEIDEGYCAIAKRRIQEAFADGGLYTGAMSGGPEPALFDHEPREQP